MDDFDKMAELNEALRAIKEANQFSQSIDAGGVGQVEWLDEDSALIADTIRAWAKLPFCVFPYEDSMKKKKLYLHYRDEFPDFPGAVVTDLKGVRKPLVSKSGLIKWFRRTIGAPE